MGPSHAAWLTYRDKIIPSSVVGESQELTTSSEHSSPPGLLGLTVKMPGSDRAGFDIRNTFNLPLTFTISVICISQIAYGFETQGYAAIQSLDAFASQFGVWEPTLQAYYLPSAWLSMFNAFGLLGLLFGQSIHSLYGILGTDQRGYQALLLVAW